MKLRSRVSGPSSSKVDKDLQCVESSSDEEVNCLVSSDSDYVGTSDEGEDFLDTLEDDEVKEVWGLDSRSKAEISDEDLDYRVRKRRKTEVKKKVQRRGSKLEKREKEDIKAVEEFPDWVIEGLKEREEMDVDFLGIKELYDEPTRKKKRKGNKDRPTLLWEVWEEGIKRWVESNLGKDVNLDNHNEVVPESAEPPSDLIMPLLRYQKEWLAWALKQEESKCRGGVLADEMGMGKTVQAIALVLAKRELSRAVGEFDLVLSEPTASTQLPAVKGTLVICPLVAVTQWVSEIDRFTSNGSNKVLVYHGSSREKSFSQFSEYDFVITTYSIVESEYRKYVLPPKQKCQWCGKAFYDKKLSIHLKYFCGPHAVRTAKQSKQQRKKTTSVVNVSDDKTKAATDEARDSERVLRNRGKNKHHIDCREPGQHYSPDGSSGAAESLSCRKSILHSIKWKRIILDEAHFIKDRRSNTTRAVLALESSYKWALSGTPLQNRVGELYSLVRFLQIIPYSYYFCKDCDCKALDYSSSTECPFCPHKSVRHFCWWNKYISNPIQAEGNFGNGRGAMILLKHKILKSILLRRTKKGRAADLALPPRIVSLRRDTLDVTEEDYYTSVYNDSQAQFDTYVRAGTVMNNYAHIFDLLTRLRQAVDHPYLVEYSNSAMSRSGGVGVLSDEQVCGLCHEPFEDRVVTSCGHVFCKSCVIGYSSSSGKLLCPSCSKLLTVDFTTNKDNSDQSSKTTIKGFKASSILNRIRLDDFQTSTKIDALREEINFMVERDGSAKGIVFSQFTSFLDLIHYSLQKSGVRCVQLVGSMTMDARNAAITRFTEDPDCRIFLMSLKAGGVALNLTVASHVFLMDPWWNPAVERQAQDRIHRIGQYKPIRIVRFVIENTIEERILKLQEKKELVFEGTVGGSLEALGKLTEADLRFLFVT